MKERLREHGQRKRGETIERRVEVPSLRFLLDCAYATHQNVTSQSCRSDRSRSGNTSIFCLHKENLLNDLNT